MRIGWRVALWALVGTTALTGCRKSADTRNESNPQALPGSGGAGGTHAAQNRGGVMGAEHGSSSQNQGPIEGTVTQVGQDQLQVQTPSGTQTVQADEKTQVVVRGLPVEGNQISLVPEGSQVRATFRGAGADAKALRIEVLDQAQGGPQDEVPSMGSDQSPNQPSGSLGSGQKQGGSQQ